MRLFLISILSLFLELLFIRWIGTEINIFAYLQNTVLVVCFLGLGSGLLSCERPPRMTRALVCLVILVACLTIPATRYIFANISLLLSAFDDLIIWTMGTFDTVGAAVTAVICGLVLSLFLLILVWEIFLPFGRILGKLMNEHPKPLAAYSANIAGSLAGVWLFVILSFSYQPPWVWFAAAALLCLPFLDRSARERGIQALLLIVAVGATALVQFTNTSPELKWSPYQKLELTPTDPESMWFRKYTVAVNNVGYQGLMDFRPESIASAPPSIDRKMAGLSEYDIPLLLHPSPKRVLVVGAGTGNDVAAALRQGAEHVTGVEIDPVILGYGRKYHPEKPYDSAKVSIVNDDARSFFANTHEKFDVVNFGLLDSHTTPSLTNIRLDHFVYTKESISQAARLLNPGGVLTLAFNVQRLYITDRIARTLRDVTGEEPLAYNIPISHYGPGGVLFVAGNRAALKARIAANPPLATLLDELDAAQPVRPPYVTKVTTDDWPYLYLASASIPKLYWLLAAMLCILTLFARRRLSQDGTQIHREPGEAHFFFLGAAFLLLETQGLSRAAAVLGSTWIVNAVIISGVLLMILIANAIVSRFPRVPSAPLYSALAAVCVGLYFVDYESFYTLSYGSKALAVALVTTCPIGLSGIIFAQSFSAAARKDTALGANLAGAVVGGVLQSITFLIGVKAVLFVVAALYLCAWGTKPKAAVLEA